MIWKSENQLEYKTYINRVYIYICYLLIKITFVFFGIPSVYQDVSMG